MSQIDNSVMSRRVSELGLSVRSFNCLQRSKIEVVGDLVQNTLTQLRSIRNMGETSVREIDRALRRLGLRLGMDMSVVQRNVPPSVMSMRTDELDLSVRAYNCLQLSSITYVQDLVQKSEEELMKVRNMGTTSVRDIKRALSVYGLRLGMTKDKVMERINVSNKSGAHDLDSFIKVIHVLGRRRIFRVADIAGMTPNEILAFPEMGKDNLNALIDGLERWGLSLHEIPDEEPPFRFEHAKTVRDELIAIVCHSLSGERDALRECFLAYHGVKGDRVHSLRKIGEAGNSYGFERPVTRERVRQVVERAEGKVRANAAHVEIGLWKPAVEEALRSLPSSAHSFALQFGYPRARESEHVFDMLKLCAKYV